VPVGQNPFSISLPLFIVPLQKLVDFVFRTASLTGTFDIQGE